MKVARRKRLRVPRSQERLTFAQKFTRLSARMRDPEWRRFFMLICAGKAIGITALLVMILSLPTLWSAATSVFEARHAYGQATTPASTMHLAWPHG